MVSIVAIWWLRRKVKEPWAVITDEPPTLQTLWQYALRFRVEELFLDSKSGRLN